MIYSPFLIFKWQYSGIPCIWCFVPHLIHYAHRVCSNYLIYVNDIHRAANAAILSYADDTSLLLSIYQDAIQASLANFLGIVFQNFGTIGFQRIK